MGANVDAGEFAEKLPLIVREIQRNRMGRSIPGPKQNVPGTKEFPLANLNKLNGKTENNGQ
jgi:hypothetical protein